MPSIAVGTIVEITVEIIVELAQVLRTAVVGRPGRQLHRRRRRRREGPGKALSPVSLKT